MIKLGSSQVVWRGGTFENSFCRQSTIGKQCSSDQDKRPSLEQEAFCPSWSYVTNVTRSRMLLQIDWGPVTSSVWRCEPLKQNTWSCDLIGGSSELWICSVTEHVAAASSSGSLEVHHTSERVRFSRHNGFSSLSKLVKEDNPRITETV